MEKLLWPGMKKQNNFDVIPNVSVMKSVVSIALPDNSAKGSFTVAITFFCQKFHKCYLVCRLATTENRNRKLIHILILLKVIGEYVYYDDNLGTILL